MKIISVAGLGSGSIEYLPSKTLDLLLTSSNIFLRTENHPVVDNLRKKGVVFKSFDWIYEEAESFEQVYDTITNTVLNAAENEEVIYAVPGHPLVGEKTVAMLMQAAGENIELIPATSCLDAIFAVLKIDPTKGIRIDDCLQLQPDNIEPNVPMLCTQLYNRRIASEVKLTLMEIYPDNHRVKIVKAAKIPGEERVEEVPLYKLDRLEWIDHLTSLYVPSSERDKLLYKEDKSLSDLKSVMSKLREPDGCPWDAKQNHKSLKRYMIEETYEVIEAIDEEDMYKLCEELGDLLLQVVFHSQIASETGEFDINDVVAGVVDKLIRRHPHVFGNVQVSGVEEVNANWERIKSREKKNRPRFDIPKSLPALMRAEKVQKKAADTGFDWPDISGAWDKVLEELQELEAAISSDSSNAVRSELGDLLFSIVNVARHLEVDPEEALSASIEKFIQRFEYIEEQLYKDGTKPEEASLQKMDALWEKAKKNIKNS